jgi:signal transduction histidine kinase
VESGHLDISISPLDPAALIADCIALVTPMAEVRRIQIESKCDGDLPQILVDSTRFKQILINLLSNAVKYNVEGGSVIVSVTQQGEARLDISVRDTGRGLSADDCAELFEPFQRLGAEKTSVEGTGLGLVLAKRMVEAMEGAISVESELGQGSTFTLSVPIVAL